MNSSAIAKLLATIVTGGFMLVPVAAQSNSLNKQDVKSSIQYRCMQRSGIPATVAYTPRGAIELIQWQKDYFQGEYTPERRCQEVSSRFQQHSQANNLRFISTGVVNNYKAICIAEQTGDCKTDGLLLTLEPNDNSEEVLRNLFSLEARRQTGGVLRGGTPAPEPEKATIDLNEFFADSPTVDDSEYTAK